VDADQGRSELKRQAIMTAAAEAFLRDGYRGTSMDAVAAAARVSKQTVYKHFSDKERLFSEIVSATVNEAANPVDLETRLLQDSADVEADLRRLGRSLLTLVMQPKILSLRRLVIAEAGRFPELGRMFLERGAGRTVQVLALAFEALSARGQLQVDDARVAAAQFNWLIMSRPINDAMLLGQDRALRPSEIARFVDEGLATFMAAYGPPPRSRVGRPPS